jgi:hypothetical protein
VTHTGFSFTTYPRKWRSNNQPKAKACFGEESDTIKLNNKQVSFYFCHLFALFCLSPPLVLDGLTPADGLSSECARRDANVTTKERCVY